jgi:hypothetical protein
VREIRCRVAAVWIGSRAVVRRAASSRALRGANVTSEGETRSGGV